MTFPRCPPTYTIPLHPSPRVAALKTLTSWRQAEYLPPHTDPLTQRRCPQSDQRQFRPAYPSGACNPGEGAPALKKRQGCRSAMPGAAHSPRGRFGAEHAPSCLAVPANIPKFRRGCPRQPTRPSHSGLGECPATPSRARVETEPPRTGGRPRGGIPLRWPC